MTEAWRDGGLDVSVVVCTRNRAPQLRRMLESACDLVIPPGLRWELLIVDNASSDGTADVARRFEARLPIRLLHEPSPGLAMARNRAVDEAQGRYLCWTDDDVLVDRNWLAAYVSAFRAHPEAAIFGGKVLPRLEEPSPAWCRDNLFQWPLSAVYAHRDMGEDPVPVSLDGGRTPWGANMALRAVEQRRFRYDPELGVSPRLDRLGEESDVIFRMIDAGVTGWWVSDCVVTHVIGRSRQSRREVFAYFRRLGNSAAYLHMRSPGHNKDEVAGPSGLARMSSMMKRARMAAHVIAAAGFFCLRMHHQNLRSVAAAGLYAGFLSFRRHSPAASRGVKR